MNRFLVYLFFFLSIGVLRSQPDFDLNYFNDFRKIFSIQPIYYPDSSGDSLEIIVPFKFSLNYLTFEKENFGERLYSNFLLEFVFRDNNRVIRKSVIYRDTLFFLLSQKELINTRVYVRYIYTKLPLRDYELEVVLYVKERVKSKSAKADIKIYNLGNISIFSPIFASRNINGKDDYFLSLSSNSLDFTKKDKVIIIPFFAQKNILDVNFKISSNFIRTNQMNWQKEVHFDVKPILISNSPPIVFVDSADNGIIKFNPMAFTGSNLPLNFLLLEYPEKFAYLQNYNLKIITSNKLDSLILSFKIQWENPPLSLRSIQYALELMYYILTDSQYHNLANLKKEQQWGEFFETWRQFDTDTTTLFNEAMDEYYKRADFAFFNFQTIEERDGAKSERGKIFILFGKPSEIQRSIDKNGTIVENWIYYRLKKQFTFVSVFKKFELVKITDL